MKNFIRPLLTVATALPLIFLATPKAEARLSPSLTRFIQRVGFENAEAVPNGEQLQQFVDTYCENHPGGDLEQSKEFDLLLLKGILQEGFPHNFSVAFVTSLSFLERNYGCYYIHSSNPYEVKLSDNLIPKTE